MASCGCDECILQLCNAHWLYLPLMRTSTQHVPGRHISTKYWPRSCLHMVQKILSYSSSVIFSLFVTESVNLECFCDFDLTFSTTL